ncbi:NAD(P)-dependent oxidoreductase [Ponticaulis sp.]|uniref:NAD-dependent epimerase/dehydratase family protein n=1 Tax=Ponticaulis sp. TaxID=2020902 RepID=UPI002609FFFC|nr:NAD(P)-dependent oxidoreductase [Ponticaulis sp.]MDF1679606.1 NAD(P)-dependent oxidoreductase [Ponticaulis sp.]
MTTVLVTGATGFLGGALTRRLLLDGVRVVALGRNQNKLSDLQSLGATTLQCDLADLPDDMRPESCDIVVHAAALSSPWGRAADFERANITGTANALRLAERVSARRFINISSPSVYFRFADQDRLREDDPLPAPVNAYADTKRRAEYLVSEASEFETVTLRPRGLYGPGDTALLPRLLKAAKTRPLPLMRGGEAATDLTFVDDVVESILAAMGAPSSVSGQAFNISGGVALPVKMVAECAGEKAGIDVRWRRVPWPLVKTFATASEHACAMLPKRPEPAVTAYSAGLFAFRQTLNIQKAEQLLGWRPKVSFDEGLEKTFAGRTE